MIVYVIKYMTLNEAGLCVNVLSSHREAMVSKDDITTVVRSTLIRGSIYSFVVY